MKLNDVILLSISVILISWGIIIRMPRECIDIPCGMPEDSVLCSVIFSCKVIIIIFGIMAFLVLLRRLIK